MARRANRTIDHDVIRNWVEERNGHPAHVLDTGADDDPGILRIDFPGWSGEGSLGALDWNTWFEWFDRNELAFLFQDGDSRFNKLVRRTPDEVEEASTQEAPSGREGVSREDRELAQASRRGATRITIMNASREELEELWGVGEHNADRIIRFRRQHPIRNESDLREIAGFDGETARLIASQIDFG